MLEIITASSITALCSILHGKGDTEIGNGKIWEGKGFIIALHVALLFALINSLSIVCAFVFWMFLRNGKQARAEIDYIMGKATLKDIRGAYPLGLGYIIAPAISKCAHRRQQEYISGAIIGAVLFIPLAAASFI